MTRAELTEQIVVLVGESDLSAADRLAALSQAQAKMRKFHAPMSPSGLQSKSFKPITRPSGKMMGKQRREAKDG